MKMAILIGVYKIKTITTTPPLITQFYDRPLLSKPMPKFYNDADTLFEMYEYVKVFLSKKIKVGNKEAKFLEYEKIFLGLYERAKKKEAELKEKEEATSAMSFGYYFNGHRYRKGLLELLRKRMLQRKLSRTLERQNDQVSKAW
jgi:hypothetical protein